jgi:hypothetical protein
MCCWSRDVPAGSLTDRHSQHKTSVPALALSPVDGPHAPDDRRISQISEWTSTVSSEQGDDPTAPRAHQQSPNR